MEGMLTSSIDWDRVRRSDSHLGTARLNGMAGWVTRSSLEFNVVWCPEAGLREYDSPSVNRSDC